MENALAGRLAAAAQILGSAAAFAVAWEEGTGAYHRGDDVPAITSAVADEHHGRHRLTRRTMRLSPTGVMPI
jgi:hypothetical protein